MIILEAEKRTTLGKSVSVLRAKGLLPAVVYGAKVASRPITIPEKAFQKAFREAGESALITLSVEGKQLNVLIHDVALDPLTEKPLHADFLAVEMDKEIKTKVPLEFIGEAPAERLEGGVVVKVMHEIEIAALPKDLPHAIEVDLSPLEKIESRLVVSDLKAPAGVRILGDADEVIVLIAAPRSEEELKSLETALPAATVEVETEREAKKKVEEAKAAEAGTEE